MTYPLTDARTGAPLADKVRGQVQTHDGRVITADFVVRAQ